jgi:uncharacterized repeat protein (TIGR01451 family)
MRFTLTAFSAVARAGIGTIGIVVLLCISLLQPRAQAQMVADEACRNREILFVAFSQPAPLRDKPLIDRLRAAGHTVTVRAAAQVQASDANGKHLVIISESSNSPDINTRLRDIPVPIVTWEGFLYDDLGMTGPTASADYGSLGPATTILVVNPKHPLAAGLPEGKVEITISPAMLHWGIPNNNASVIAVVPDEVQKAHIFAYEQGAMMVGLTAPARRVGIPYATGQFLNDAGFAIYDAAVAWAMLCDDPPPTATDTATPPPTATETATPIATSTGTATTVPPHTPTNTPPHTPTGTATNTPTRPSTTPPPTNTATATATFSPTPVIPPTATATPTASATMAATATTAPGTPTSTATFTPQSPTATVSPTPFPTVEGIDLVVLKRDFLFVDADESDSVSPGDELLYQIEVTNRGPATAEQVRLLDVPDPHTQLMVGRVRTSRGTITRGNALGDNEVLVEIDTLAADETAVIGFQVIIDATTSAPQVDNQATVTFVRTGAAANDTGTTLSDDPETAALNDPTITAVEQTALAPNFQIGLPVIRAP